MNSLAQKNPWFVQSLQNIMSTAAVQEGSLPPQLPVRPDVTSSVVSPLPPPPPGGDPAQAALILLLAGECSIYCSKYRLNLRLHPYIISVQ